jgi:hypothetical protein
MWEGIGKEYWIKERRYGYERDKGKEKGGRGIKI